MLFGGQHLPSRHLALPNFTSLHWSASGCPPEASHLTPRQWSFWTTSHLKAGSRNAFRLLKFNGSTNIGEVVTSLLAPVARCFALAESAITGSMSMPKYMQLQIQNFIAHIHAHGWMHGHFLFVEPACQFSPWLMRVHMSAFKRKKSFWPRKSVCRSLMTGKKETWPDSPTRNDFRVAKSRVLSTWCSVCFQIWQFPRNNLLFPVVPQAQSPTDFLWIDAGI